MGALTLINVPDPADVVPDPAGVVGWPTGPVLVDVLLPPSLRTGAEVPV
jgi:hypothetical protein